MEKPAVKGGDWNGGVASRGAMTGTLGGVTRSDDGFFGLGLPVDDPLGIDLWIGLHGNGNLLGIAFILTE
jgi:hypothetical protein